MIDGRRVPIAEVDDDHSSTIQFEEFCNLMQRKLQVEDGEKELRECFRVWDERNTGFISIPALRQIIAGITDGLDEEEVEENRSEAFHKPPILLTQGHGKNNTFPCRRGEKVGLSNTCDGIKHTI